MFDRFTDRARKVLALANAEAQRWNHEYIGTEHLLLGLIQEGEGLGAKVLEGLGASLPTVHAEVEKLVKAGPKMVTIGRLHQTPRAQQVIAFSIEEARNLDHNYVGTEHLLLGLVRVIDGVAAQVIRSLGLTLDEVRQEVHTVLGTSPAPSGNAAHRAEPTVTCALSQFSNDARRVIEIAYQEARRAFADLAFLEGP